VDQPSRIAELLRQAREQRGLTTEQAAADSGVPLRYARQLEGDPRAAAGVSDELYLVPFLRRYAAFLGVDAEQLLPDFLGHVQEVPGLATPRVPLRYPARAVRLWRPAATMVAVAGAALFIVRHSPERPALEDEPWSEPAVRDTDTAGAPAEPVAVVAAADATAEATGVPPGAVSASPAPPPGAEPTPERLAPVVDGAMVAAKEGSGASVANAKSGGGGNPRELRVVAKEETWLAVGIDGAAKKEFTLRAGESHTWTANDAFSLTVGNAGGITVVLDGRELPPLGGSGQVVRNFRLPETEAHDR
jgi:cytoskeleton protein RodZ